MIRPVTTTDAAAVAAIYNHYIAHTAVTFEETAHTGATMAERIAEITAAELPWLVAVDDDVVLGYAYASKWKGRCAYRYTAESTVYLAPTATGRGLGTALYTALLAQLREEGLHCVIGGVALPNAASVALHEKLGFQKVAQFKEVGFKFGQWIDVGYWEVML